MLRRLICQPVNPDRVARKVAASRLCMRLVVGLAALLAASPLHAAWFDNNWPLRRCIDVDWPADKPTGDELAWVTFFTAGRHQPDGADLRIATEDGTLVPSRVLMVGPGDQMRVVFALRGTHKRYYAYFGNPQPPAAPQGAQQVPWRWGLHMEMRKVGQDASAANARQLHELWAKSPETLGQTMLDRLFLGLNPFGEHPHRVSRLSGMLRVPSDGNYIFAGSADARGALYVDGRPILWIPHATGETRLRATVPLKRGKYELLFLHLAHSGDARFSVVWQRPDRESFEIIGHDALGTPYKTVVSALEERGKTFTSDFKLDYVGECFFNWRYTHRYRFSAAAPKVAAQQAKYEWDFGDGQSAVGQVVEHVYLANGHYPVKLTTHIGTNNDTQITQISVSRWYERLDRAPADSLTQQSKLVQSYDLANMPVAWLPWATRLHVRAEEDNAALAAARRLVTITSGLEPHLIVDPLRELTKALTARGKSEAALALWEALPADSPAWTSAAPHYAYLLLWQAADFAKAKKILQPLIKPDSDNALRRLYAHALVLSGQAEEGTKILESMPIAGPPGRQAVISGAQARTIEYYLTEGDWETGQEVWDRWQAQYPADFLEGYSVLLRSRLIERQGVPQAAARVAEAFSLAVPTSTYTPTLLDHASKLLAKSDPARSRALRQLLRQKYPEDPLAQDTPTTTTAPASQP